VHDADQRPAHAPVRVEQALEHVGTDPARAVEAHVEALVVEPAEEAQHGIRVGGQRRPQSQRPSMAEDDIADVRRGR
jgi:hypothetical protein